jgi:hypothetical protein
MMHVTEIENSIRFYELLGFVTIDTDRSEPLGWARLHCDGGAVMFLRAEAPVDSSTHSAMLYMYTPDLIGLREQLQASGVQVPAITHPPYMLGGEMCLRDPDGNVIFLGHWGKPEQEAWERRIAKKP